GIAILIPLYIMFYLHIRYDINFNITYAYFRTANTGYPVIALAFIFKGVSTGIAPCEMNESLGKKSVTVILKSSLCFIMLILASWILFYMFAGTVLDLLFDVKLLFSLLAIFYSYLLYRLVRKYRAAILIVMV